MDTTIQFVVGFLFHTPLNLVAVMRKRRPVWQYDKFNGIGGKIEPICQCCHTHNNHVLGTDLCNICQKNSHMIKPEHICTGFKFDRMETPFQAMCREWKEETGTDFINWQPFCTLHGETRRDPVPPYNKFTTHFFSGYALTMQPMMALRSMTDEPIVVESIHHITPVNSVADLPWMIRCALDSKFNDIQCTYEITERYAQ